LADVILNAASSLLARRRSNPLRVGPATATDEAEEMRDAPGMEPRRAVQMFGIISA